MSILHSRIAAQGHGGPAYHPAVTPATPTVMPVAHVEYRADSTLYYEALVPVIAADGAIIPSRTGVLPPDVIPAGRP